MGGYIERMGIVARGGGCGGVGVGVVVWARLRS